MKHRTGVSITMLLILAAVLAGCVNEVPVPVPGPGTGEETEKIDTGTIELDVTVDEAIGWDTAVITVSRDDDGYVKTLYDEPLSLDIEIETGEWKVKADLYQERAYMGTAEKTVTVKKDAVSSLALNVVLRDEYSFDVFYEAMEKAGGNPSAMDLSYSWSLITDLELEYFNQDAETADLNWYGVMETGSFYIVLDDSDVYTQNEKGEWESPESWIELGLDYDTFLSLYSSYSINEMPREPNFTTMTDLQLLSFNADARLDGLHAEIDKTAKTFTVWLSEDEAAVQEEDGYWYYIEPEPLSYVEWNKAWTAAAGDVSRMPQTTNWTMLRDDRKNHVTTLSDFNTAGRKDGVSVRIERGTVTVGGKAYDVKRAVFDVNGRTVSQEMSGRWFEGVNSEFELFAPRKGDTVTV